MLSIEWGNRLFWDRQSGLIADYIGIAQNFKSALPVYGPDDRGKADIDESQTVAVMIKQYVGGHDLFQSYGYRMAFGGRGLARTCGLRTFGRSLLHRRRPKAVFSGQV